MYINFVLLEKEYNIARYLIPTPSDNGLASQSLARPSRRSMTAASVA